MIYFYLSWFPEETKKTQCAKGAQVRLKAEKIYSNLRY